MTPKRKRFIQEYLVDLNATQAYIRAGFTASTRHTAESGASMLMRNYEVSSEITALLEERGERTKLTADRVLLEIERLAKVDPTAFAKVKKLSDLAKLSPDLRRAVVGWSWDKRGNLVLKLAKERALEMLGRHHKLFTEVVEHKGLAELATRLAKAQERVK